MAHRSISQLNSLSDCGERYRLERTVPGLPVRPAAWTVVGTAAHTAYEVWEKTDRVMDLSELFFQHYTEEIAVQQTRQPDAKLWVKTPNVKTVERDIDLRLEHGVKQMRALQEHCEQSEWRVAEIGGKKAIEVPLEVTFGDVLVLGHVDVVLEWPDGKLSARDWKTGHKKGTKNRQLGFYKLGLNEKYGLDIRFGDFFFTKLGDSGGYVDLSRYTRDYLHDQFTKLNRIIEEGLYLANPGEHCDLCTVKFWCREMGTPPK